MSDARVMSGARDGVRVMYRARCAGVKFVVTARPSARELDALARRVYEAYADYVLKVCAIARAVPRAPSVRPPAPPQNPFYELEQPIRCELFDAAVLALGRKFSGVGDAAAR